MNNFAVNSDILEKIEKQIEFCHIELKDAYTT